MADGSKKISIPELDLFSPPLRQDYIEREFTVEYRPVNQLSDDAPVIFDITEQKNFIDLRNSQIYVKMKIVKKDGTPVTAIKKIAPVNNSLHSLFERVSVIIEGKEVVKSCRDYPFKAIFSTLLGYDRTAKETQLLCQGFSKDDADDMNSIAKNVGAGHRSRLFKQSRSVVLQGPLYEDIFMLKRYLLNNTRMTIRLDRTTPQFYLMYDETAGDGSDYKVKLEAVVLKARMIELKPWALYAIGKTMETKPALYPFVQREMRVLNLPVGYSSGSFDNLFPDKLPSRVIMALVPADAYNGDYRKNPFWFKPFDLNDIALWVNGIEINRYTPSFKNVEGNEVAPAYLSLYETFGALGDNVSNDITLKDYAQGYAMYAYNVKPPLGSMDEDDKGNVRVLIKFEKALTEAACLLVHAETPCTMEISESRNVTMK